MTDWGKLLTVAVCVFVGGWVVFLLGEPKMAIGLWVSGLAVILAMGPPPALGGR